MCYNPHLLNSTRKEKPLVRLCFRTLAIFAFIAFTGINLAFAQDEPAKIEEKKPEQEVVIESRTAAHYYEDDDTDL